MGSLQTVGQGSGSGVYGDRVSQPLLPASMWAFSLLSDEQKSSQPVFRFFSEEIILYLAVDSVCL